MTNLLHPVRRGTVRLLPGLFLQRYQLNRSYMLSLKTENLLQKNIAMHDRTQTILDR